MYRTVSRAAFALALLLSAPLSAQLVYNSGSSPMGGTINVIPFGTAGASSTWSNQKYQTVMAAKILPVVGSIGSLGFTSGSTGVKTFDTIKIVMGYLPASMNGVLTTNFANNLTSPVTVLEATNYSFYVKTDTWTHVGLQKPFIYIGAKGDLVFEITVTNARGPGTSGFHRGGTGAGQIPVQRMYATGTSWANNKPPATGTFNAFAGLRMEVGFGTWALDSFGVGCAGSNSQTPALTATGSAAFGAKLGLNMSGALPLKPFFLVIGLAQYANPIDMTPMGAPGCSIHITLDIPLTFLSDNTGNWSGQFPVPKNTSLGGTKTYLQCFPLDPAANKFGMSSSNYVRVLIGK